MLTVASYITLVRLFLTPVVVYYIWQQQWLMAIFIFLFAAATDLLDGLVARRFNQQSTLGQLLDPIADKCLIMGTLYSLLFHVPVVFGIDYLIFFLLFKEIILLIGGAFLKVRYNFFIPPTTLSRAASLGEVVLILLLFAYQISLTYYGLESFLVTFFMAGIIFVLVVTMILSVWLLSRYVGIVRLL
jgi:cardiolipin synthase